MGEPEGRKDEVDSESPDLDPDEALTDPTDDFDDEAVDPDVYEPEPGDPSYVEPGTETPVEGQS